MQGRAGQSDSDTSSVGHGQVGQIYRTDREADMQEDTELENLPIVILHSERGQRQTLDQSDDYTTFVPL